MKKGMRLLVLGGVLVALAGSAAGLSAYRTAQEAEKEAREQQDTSIAVLSVDENAIASIETDYEGDTFTLLRRDGIWQMADDADFSVRQSYAGNMTGALENLTSQTSLAAENPAEYGLEQARCTVRVTDTLGREHVLEIGDKNVVTGEVYIRVNGGDTVYTIPSVKAGYFLRGRMGMLEEEAFPSIDVADVTRVALSSGRVLTRDAEDLWRDETGARLDTAKTEDYLKAVTQLSTNGTLSAHWRTDGVTYGLDEPEMQIEIAYTLRQETSLNASARAITEWMRRYGYIARVPGLLDEIVIREQQTREQKTKQVLLERWGVAQSGETAYTLARTQTLVLTIGDAQPGGDYAFTHSRTARALTVTQGTRDALLACGEEELRVDGVVDVQMADVASLRVSAQGTVKTVYTRRVFEKEDGGTYRSATVYEMDGETVTASLYRRLFNALCTLSAQAYAPGGEEQPRYDAQADGVIEAHFDLFDGTEHTLVLVPYDGSFYMALLDGAGDKLISRRDVESVLTAFDALAVETEEPEK